MKIEQYCKRRKYRKKPKRQEDSSCVFAYYFYRGTCHRRDTAGKGKASKLLRHRLSERCYKKPPGRCDVRTVKGVASSRPCMPQSERGAGHTGYRIFSDPLPGGSQDTGGAFRSRVRRHGVRHRSIGAGHICPMWQRTDLTQVKRDRHTSKPRKTRNTKAFRLSRTTAWAVWACKQRKTCVIVTKEKWKRSCYNFLDDVCFYTASTSGF